MQKIYHKIRDNNELWNLLGGELSNCKKIFDNQDTLNKNGNFVIRKILDRKKLLHRNLCKFFLLFDREKYNIFPEIICEMANIENYFGIVEILKMKKGDCTFCIPILDLKSDTPYMCLKKFWNVSLDWDSIDTIVTNDINFGRKLKNRNKKQILDKFNIMFDLNIGHFDYNNKIFKNFIRLLEL